MVQHRSRKDEVGAEILKHRLGDTWFCTSAFDVLRHFGKEMLPKCLVMLSQNAISIVLNHQNQDFCFRSFTDNTSMMYIDD